MSKLLLAAAMLGIAACSSMNPYGLEQGISDAEGECQELYADARLNPVRDRVTFNHQPTEAQRKDTSYPSPGEHAAIGALLDIAAECDRLVERVFARNDPNGAEVYRALATGEQQILTLLYERRITYGDANTALGRSIYEFASLYGDHVRRQKKVDALRSEAALSAFAAGVQSYSYSAPNYTPPTPVTCPYAPNCLNNPYGAGNPYKSDGLMNPYSQYGNPYSNKSWTNPYATQAPRLYDEQGNYRGRLSSNPYDPDSVSNPYGRYGNPYSSDSINNPYGAGNPYSGTEIYVVPE